MEDSFLPTDYKVPSTSNYMKMTEGEHTFRIITPAIVGYEYFKTDNKPVRSRTAFEETPTDIKEKGRIMPFWAFVVWNYEEKRIQILELTQKTLMLPLKALVDNPKWGNPRNYDITITRKGSSVMDTEYAVMPNPHTPVPAEAQKALESKIINHDMLYESKDPFAPESN